MFSWYLPEEKSEERFSREVLRVDLVTLRELFDNGKVDESESRRVLLEKVFPKLCMTKHLRDRLSRYINRPSLCGTYLELYPREFGWLLSLPRWLQSGLPFEIVEIGFNQEREICKVALVINVAHLESRFLGRSLTSRVLFVCIGTDGGIKTLYISPSFKNRSQYNGQVTYASLQTLSYWLWNK